MKKTCGCTAETCGCCEGIQVLTPQSTANRPGLSALNYRVGTHGAFLETMKARLTTMTLQLPAADGRSIETFTPLRNLTTRDSGDFSIALLDSWASVADVLTFYQERIANEGYLRTAVERRSIIELARLVAYTLRPGVAATVYVAYTIDEDRSVPPPKPTVTAIAQGSAVQSVPGPGELPQTFETSDALEASSDWNNLQVRLTQPQNITLTNALAIDRIFVAGADTKLEAGDSLLLAFGDEGDPSVLRTVASVEGQFDQNQTLVQFQPVAPAIVAATPVLADFVAKAKPLVTSNTSGAGRRLVEKAQAILSQTYLGLASAPDTWAGDILNAADGTPDPPIEAAFLDFAEKLSETLKELPSPPVGVVTDPSKFVTPLLLAQKVQPATSLQLTRNLRVAFNKGADSNPQLLVKFAPQLSTTFYRAWASATVNSTPPSLKGVFALRVEAAIFGANAPKEPTYNGTVPKKPSDWDEWPLDITESRTTIFLDQSYGAIEADSLVVIQQTLGGAPSRSVKRVDAAQTVHRTAYGVSGKTTQLSFADDWRDDIFDFSSLRPVLVRAKSEPLTLVEEPIASDVQGQEIPLDELYDSLTSGRWVIVLGERTDIPGVSGVNGTELLMIAGLRQDFDAALPGDKTHTTLLFATPMAFSYKRDTATIYGNVVKATHGETRNETLGNGGGSQSLQSFTLKQPPLTFVPASNPKGIDTTLEVFVNDVQWHETDTLASLGPKDRKFITKTDDDGKTTVIFGNGEQGARLPTGMANVKSVYRSGIGKPGNVKAEQVSLLQTRPLGVKSVINPLPASGGADKENRDQARENAPLAVMSLDRLISVQDYADFTRTFAGIGRAAARKLSDTKRQLVHVTIAGADDIPIDPTSDLYKNLLIALRRLGDPELPVQVDLRELVVLVLSANVRLTQDYQWDPVATQIRAALLDDLGFQKRALGQPALLSEVVAVTQGIRGVEYVDVDAFGGIPEKTAELVEGKPTGKRRLLQLDEIAEAVQKIVNPRQFPGPAPHVDANLADFEGGAIRPAQLAIFTDAVQDTLILNQIK